MEPHEYHRAAPPVMSHDGATAGHDAAVTRSVYGHPVPFHLGGRPSSWRKRVPPRLAPRPETFRGSSLKQTRVHEAVTRARPPYQPLRHMRET